VARWTLALASLLLAAPAGAATVTGTVTWSEAAPWPPLPSSKSPDVCGAKVRARHVRFGPRGAVEGAAVTLVDGPGPAPPARVVTVEIQGCQFVPRVVVLGSGSAVRFVSKDPVLHNVTVEGPQGAELMSVNLVTAGQSSPPLPLEAPGRYRVRSRAGHHWMNAHLWVLATGPVTSSDPGGRFTLRRVPPGRHRVLAWHPDLGVSARTVEVSATGTVSAGLRF